ncbi:MAG: hypothetical protein E6H79_15790, partial [Betaproteobacteria bacterium]
MQSSSMPLPLPVSAAPAEAPPTPEDVAAQALAIESENTRTLYAKLPASFVGLNLAALITVWMFWSVRPLWLIGAWVALVELNCVLRYLLLQRFRRANPRALAEWRRW